LHHGWRLGRRIGGSGHPRSQTSHSVILKGISSKVEFGKQHREKATVLLFEHALNSVK
jgi:hypothetical protein